MSTPTGDDTSDLRSGPDLRGRVALVAGGTRGAGRGIAVELGSAGATVYVTGRTTATSPSPMDRPETIEETAALVDNAGGRGVAVQVDHADSAQVSRLVEHIIGEQGQLHILVNDIWGGDPLAEWGVPFWQHDLDNGLRLLRNAIDTHLITSWHAAGVLMATPDALVVEVTDGLDTDYRGSLFYDLAKSSVIRLALAEAEEFRKHMVTVVAITPGFLRSEAMLDHFGVTAATWRDAIAKDPHFAASETPRFVGRAIAHLAADPLKFDRTGTATSSWELARRYEFTDVDGSTPDWGRHAELHL